MLEIPDGNSNVAAIRTALEHARNHVGQPKFLNITTTIGFGTTVADTCKAHQMAFGEVDIEKCKTSWGFDSQSTHFVPEDVRQDWADVPRQGQELKSQWKQTLISYAVEYPELAQQLQSKINGDLGQKWRQTLNTYEVPCKELPLRQTSAQIYDILWRLVPFFGGSADLSEPNFMIKEAKPVFGPPRPGVENVSFNGRYVHYGTREHGMIAVANGVAAYAPQAFIPITATFAMFQLYGASAIRMTAVNKVQVIHVGTHDSIAEGACGPTHQVGFLFHRALIPALSNSFQPVELVNLYRSMPDINYIRPADAEEAVVSHGPILSCR